MGIITSQKITTLYERYKTIDVTFSKEIIQVSGLITNQVYLKCVGDFWPCVIYSSSFQGAKVVTNVKTGIFKKMEQANNMVSLRFCFKNPDGGNPVTFFVTAKSIGSASYGGSNDTALVSLQFTQRPPDDLIEIMGRILDANINSAKRKEERILVTPDSIRRLSLLSKESVVFIQGVPRRCILRDISFSGAKVIMVGVVKFLLNRDVTMRMDFDDPRESFSLKGRFIRAEMVEGRKELVALALALDESTVPMGYKIRINDFLSQVRADTRGTEEVPAEEKKTEEHKEKPPAAPADPAGAEKEAAPAPEKDKETEAPEKSGSETAGSAGEDFDLVVPEKKHK